MYVVYFAINKRSKNQQDKMLYVYCIKHLNEERILQYSFKPLSIFRSIKTSKRLCDRIAILAM